MHLTATGGTTGSPPGTGSGGQTFGSGGAPGSGGQANPGSGGESTQGSGGQSFGSGSGGNGDGSGGRSGDGSGGSTGSGSGGQARTGGAPGSGGASTPGSGGAPASGAGVMINGTFVPKEKAVVFIHFGHSNMRGQTRAPASLNSYFFNTEQGLWSYNQSGFSLAKEPTAPEGTMNMAGPGMAILHSARTAAGSPDVQFISIGFGRGSVTTVDYAPGTTGYFRTFMTWAGQLKGKVTFGGVVIMLGITDGEHLPTAQVPGFPMRVANIVSTIRSELAEPNLPVLFCDYEAEASGDLAPTSTVGKTMIPLIQMLPSMVPSLVLVPTNGLAMQDDHHFNMQGHKDWADRVIMLMKSKNWFPWK